MCKTDFISIIHLFQFVQGLSIKKKQRTHKHKTNKGLEKCPIYVWVTNISWEHEWDAAF